MSFPHEIAKKMRVIEIAERIAYKNFKIFFFIFLFFQIYTFQQFERYLAYEERLQRRTFEEIGKKLGVSKKIPGVSRRLKFVVLQK